MGALACTPGTYSGTLDLTISGTGERQQYTLAGTATEPLAEGHVVVTAVAREEASKKLTVPNWQPRTVDYSVYSDLACITGKDGLRVDGGPGRVAVRPALVSVYHGC